jgi:polyisoprenoid-binding protein YceI
MNSLTSMTPMKQKLLTATVLFSTLGLSWAAPLEFNFKDPKGVNNVVFKTDAPLESINGTATAISGTVTFDPQDPGAVKGKIVVAASSLHVGNPMQKEHLHGANWMDVTQYPDMSFEVVGAKNVKTQSDVTTADVTGKMTIKATTKEITVPVKMTYLKDKLGQRVPNQQGDLLVLRSNFSVKRSDFGIGGPKMEEKVSNDIELSLSLAGAAAR